MGSQSSTSDANSTSFRGQKTVEYYNNLDPAQKYHHLSGLLPLGVRALPSSPVGKDISFLCLPEIRYPLLIGLPRKSYYRFRYNYLQRSILTATLYVQRPLTEEETSAVTYWSARENNVKECFMMAYFVGLSMGLWPQNLLRLCMTPLLKRMFTRGHFPTRYTKACAMEDIGLSSMLAMVLAVPSGYGMFLRHEERNDARLDAVRAVELEEKPGSWFERYRLWRRGYRAAMVPGMFEKTPGSRENFWDSDECRKLKYTASTFVDPPQWVLNDEAEYAT